MKTDLRGIARGGWLLLTEVPGWPDAPWRKRCRRALPVAIPVVLAALLFAWKVGIQQPELAQLRAANQPLLDLEDEVTQLQWAYSEQQVEELVAREGALRRQFPRDLREVREALHGLERESPSLGWSTTFRIQGGLDDNSEPVDGFRHVTVRGRLVPAESNATPLPSLLTLLEKIRTHPRRIDLMRMAISADEGAWQGVELDLRLAVPTLDAEAPQ